MLIGNFLVIGLRSKILRRLERFLHSLRELIDAHGCKNNQGVAVSKPPFGLTTCCSLRFRGTQDNQYYLLAMPEETRSLWQQLYSQVEPWRRG
jgi:hypothetical protein